MHLSIEDGNTQRPIRVYWEEGSSSRVTCTICSRVHVCGRTIGRQKSFSRMRVVQFEFSRMRWFSPEDFLHFSDIMRYLAILIEIGCHDSMNKCNLVYVYIYSIPALLPIICKANDIFFPQFPQSTYLERQNAASTLLLCEWRSESPNNKIPRDSNVFNSNYYTHLYPGSRLWKLQLI